MLKITRISLIVIFCLFVSIRSIHLSQSVNFGSDAGRDFLTTWNMSVHKRPTLIGPPSQYTIYGRQFYFGPAPYYIILPALVVGHWDPLAVSYFIILLNAVAFLISLIILNKHIKQKTIISLFAVLYTFMPSFVEYSQSYWNPYFLLPISTILLALLVKVSCDSNEDTNLKYKNKNKPSHAEMGLYFFIGLILGLGLQFHYSFILAIIVSSLWLLFTKKLNFMLILSLLGGFVVGFSPILLFESRNHFYNLNTLLLVLKNSKNSYKNLGLNSYYLISLMPFLLFLLSIALVKLTKNRSLIIYSFLGLYIPWSLWIVLPIKKYDLPYHSLQAVAKLIEDDKPNQFNIVDQLTGDNRAMALRYILTSQGKEPLGVSDYPSANELYIYSRIPLNQLLENPVWEIKSSLPFNTVKIWNIDNGLFIYKLEK